MKGWHSLLLTGALLMAGCQHGANAQSGIRVLSTEGQLQQHIVATDSVAQLKMLWQSKREVVVKQRPEFKHRVELGAAADEQWLYSESGYVVLASQPYGTIYLLANREEANRLLGITR
jgi:hypothetical protein